MFSTSPLTFGQKTSYLFAVYRHNEYRLQTNLGSSFYLPIRCDSPGRTDRSEPRCQNSPSNPRRRHDSTLSAETNNPDRHRDKAPVKLAAHRHKSYRYHSPYGRSTRHPMDKRKYPWGGSTGQVHNDISEVPGHLPVFNNVDRNGGSGHGEVMNSSTSAGSPFRPYSIEIR